MLVLDYSTGKAASAAQLSMRSALVQSLGSAGHNVTVRPALPSPAPPPSPPAIQPEPLVSVARDHLCVLSFQHLASQPSKAQQAPSTSTASVCPGSHPHATVEPRSAIMLAFLSAASDSKDAHASLAVFQGSVDSVSEGDAAWEGPGRG